MRSERVLVLMGGGSGESELSRQSGARVLEALLAVGYEAVGAEFDDSFPTVIIDFKPDLVFLALHGGQGENGAIQGFLEVEGIPYTGSGIAVSAMCQDKVLTKKMLSFDEIPTPEFAILNRTDFVEGSRIINDLMAYPGLPLVIKSPCQGSGIGTTIVREPEALKPALDMAFECGRQALAEKFIPGAAITVAMMGNDEAYPLPAVEFAGENGQIRNFIPPRLTPAMARKVEALAVACYERLGCRGFASIDIIADAAEGTAYVLEVDTIPAMAAGSPLAYAVEAAGMNWEEFVDRAVRLAMQQK